jgi:hypothetical protein
VSLTISVVYLAQMLHWDDPEPAKRFQAEIDTINHVLNKRKLDLIHEPKHWNTTMNPRIVQMSFPTDGLHQLREFYACIAAQMDFTPPFNADQLEIIRDSIRAATDSLENHLIGHSDNAGYYIPVDFDELLFVPEASVAGGGIVGSSYKLMRELIWIAQPLGITLKENILTDEELEATKKATSSPSRDLLYMEKRVWLALYESARVSIATGSTMVFHA